MNPFTHIGRLIRHSATGPVRLPAPLSWRMLTRDPAAAVQRAILMEYLKTGSTASRLLTLGIALLFWPFRTFTQAMRLTRQVGEEVSHIRSRPAQFFQQLWLAWFHGISPTMYYEMGVAVQTEKHPVMSWLQDGHASLLSRVFRSEKSLPELNDKLLFAKLMSANGVAVPPTLAVFDDGRLVGSSDQVFLTTVAEQPGLFVKPVRSSGGRDTILIDRRSAKCAWYSLSPRSSPALLEIFDDGDSAEIDLGALPQRLARFSRFQRILVQPYLKNHAVITQIAPSRALAAIRLLSGFNSGGTSLLRAIIFLPTGNAIISQYAYTAPVRLDSGFLGKIFFQSGSQKDLECFPGSNIRLEEFRVPHWRRVRRLIEKAHGVLADYPFVAWDVAVTDSGPVLLEANGNFATACLQKSESTPLIDDQFLSIFRHWAQKGVIQGRRLAETGIENP